MTRANAIKWLQAILDDTLGHDDERDAKRIEAVELAIEVLRSHRRPRRHGDTRQTVSGPREAYDQVRYLARQTKEHLVGLYLDAHNCLIVRETISRLPGHELRLSSKPGVGTRFDILLPLAEEARAGRACADARQTTVDEGRDEVEGGGAMPEIAIPLPRSRDVLCGCYALVVEDDPPTRRALADAMESWGMLVEAVGSSAEALSAVRGSERLFDVVVSDFNLPGATDGLGVIDAVRSEQGQRTPAILVSGCLSALDRSRLGRLDAKAMSKPLDHAQLLVGHGVVGRGDHRVDEIELLVHDPLDGHRLAGLHRAPGDEDGRDVQPQCGEQHARRDLVAVGDADQRVGPVRLDHVLHGVGDEFPARQRVEHAGVPHRDAVVDRDRVELAPHTAGPRHRAGHQCAEILEVHMPRHELGERVGDRHDRLAEVVVGHPGRAPQRAGACHRPAVRGGLRP